VKGRDESFFTGEVVKGFEVLDIMTRRFDIVATNPPYMSRGNMNTALSGFLRNQYVNSNGDLYVAFIERCSDFLRNNGRLAMITQQSFMFITSYEKMRTNLLNGQTVETMCHLGPHAFEAISGEKVNTTLFAVRKEPDEQIRKEAVGTYFRLVKEPDEESKRRRFEAALKQLKTGSTDSLAFKYKQEDFSAIPGLPLVYWISTTFRQLFRKNRTLGDLSPVCLGMRTGDNYRFIRFWWEIGRHNIAYDCTSEGQASVSQRKWFPYMKGGGFCRWYGKQEFVVEWDKNGRIIKENTKHVYPQLGENLAWKITNEPFYFRRG
jgi:hypothetical protein